MGNCLSKTYEEPNAGAKLAKGKAPVLQWEHFTKPDWGIADLLVPEGSCIRRDENGHMIGDLSYPEGSFKIHPLFNKLGLTNFSSHLESQMMFIKDEEDEAIRAKLKLPESEYVAITLADHSTMGTIHHAMLKPPNEPRHTLMFSFMLPLTGDREAPKKMHQITQKMLASLKWVDRTAVCKPVDKLVGSWLHVKVQAASKERPAKTTVVKKMKFFEENLWGYWYWIRPFPDDVKPEELEEGKHDMAEFATGEYIVYEYESVVYLYLVNTWNWVPILIETISVAADGGTLLRSGNEYKNIERGQPYRPRAEDVFGISDDAAAHQEAELN